jgi:hypothetical protein
LRGAIPATVREPSSLAENRLVAFSRQEREDFSEAERLEGKFWKFERRKTVEEKDMQLEPEADVQAHQQLGQNAANLEADEKGVHHREDEGEDVEGHVQYAVNAEPAADAVNAAHDDEDDDVEGHVNY